MSGAQVDAKQRPGCFNRATRRELVKLEGQDMAVEVDNTGYLRLRAKPVETGEVFYTLQGWRWQEDARADYCTVYRTGEHVLRGYDCRGCRWAGR